MTGVHGKEYGYAALSNVDGGLINQERERRESGIHSVASVQGSLVMYPIFTFGSDDQKKTGCRRWRRVRPSAALDSQSPATDPTRPA